MNAKLPMGPRDRPRSNAIHSIPSGSAPRLVSLIRTHTQAGFSHPPHQDSPWVDVHPRSDLPHLRSRTSALRLFRVAPLETLRIRAAQRIGTSSPGFGARASDPQLHRTTDHGTSHRRTSALQHPQHHSTLLLRTKRTWFSRAIALSPAGSPPIYKIW